MILMSPEFITTSPGFGWGAVGGVMRHSYWLIAIGHAAGGVALSSSKRHRNFRLSLFVLSAFVGAIAGFLTFTWFLTDLQTGVLPKEKICVLAGIAGLSFESVLQILGKPSSVSG